MIYKLEVRKANTFSRVKGYEGTSKGFQPGHSSKGRFLNTGLIVDESKEINEEKEFEEKLGLPPGALSKTVGADGIPVSSYWRNFKLEIPPKGLELNDEVPLDALCIKILTASKLVSAGKGKPSASAIWDLYTDEQAARDKNVERGYKKEAYIKISDMSTQDMITYLTSLGMNVDATKPETTESIIGDLIESNAKVFMENIEHALYKERAFIYKLVNAKVLMKIGDSIYYNDILLGLNADNAIEFLNKREQRNQEVKVALMKRLEEVTNANSYPITSTEKEEEKESEEEKELEKETVESDDSRDT